MALREFTDTNGWRWQVWDTRPSRGGDALLGASGYVQPGFESGWLVFEADSERRRLAPIPDGWSDCPEPDLAAYCERAVPARRTTG